MCDGGMSKMNSFPFACLCRQAGVRNGCLDVWRGALDETNKIKN